MSENPYPEDNVYTNQHAVWNEGFIAALDAVLMVIENEPDHARVMSLRLQEGVAMSENPPECFGDYCRDVDGPHDCKYVTECFFAHLERIRNLKEVSP